MILVDSNVLIDIAQSDALWADWSAGQFARAFDQDELLAIPRSAAFAASKAHQRYRQAGGARVATLPDFFIAAHAQAEGAPSLTRDATRARTYFPDLLVIAPA